jgi:hypothetical protein
MEQTTLGLDLDQRRSEPPLEHRRRLVELMAAAILAVHRASEEDVREDNVDDDAHE